MLRVLKGRPRRSRSTILVGLLLLTLCLAAVLAHQAQDAARSHRATAERTLRDYATVAAWEFNTHAKEEFWQALVAAFRPCKAIDTASPHPRLPPPEILAEESARLEACKCATVLPADYYFLVDFRDRSVKVTAAAGGERAERWLADTVMAHARSEYEREFEFATLFHGQGRAARAVVYTLRRDDVGAPVAAYGFVTDPRRFGDAIYPRVMKKWALLPYPLTGGLPSDSLLSVTILGGGGTEIYRSSAHYESAFVSEVPWKKWFGGMVTQVSLRPEASDRLVIGGLPRSRLPVLLGVLLLTAVLIAVALIQLRRESELARLRADFVSSISHELRTPLAQIRMFAETLMLGRVRSDGERRRSLEIIDQEARRLAHLVENVLHFSRTERQRLRLSPEPTELACQLREVVETFGPIARARRVDVRAELQDGVVARVDRGALRQMLLNLLDNAVKYGPPGQTVTLRLRSDGGLARIEVADEGPGIAPALRERIFEPFCRLERDANSAIGGSGIGLAVVRELALLHGGRAYADAAPGGGALFVVELSLTSETPTGPMAPSLQASTPVLDDTRLSRAPVPAANTSE